MTCNPCQGTGFKNIEQVPAKVVEAGTSAIQTWIATQTEPHDVCICDCCGDGEEWYGVPGAHYSRNDPRGPRGPYAYNGGLCECS